MSIRKSLRATWMLFEASEESKISVYFNRLLYLTVPIILSSGVGITLAQAASSVPLGIFFGLICASLLLTGMSMVTPQAQEQVTRHDHDLEELPVDADVEYVKTFEIPSKDIQPAFYQGAGEWICKGHVPPSDFIENVLEYDPFLTRFNYQDLEDALQYNYAVRNYSVRLRRNALKIVHKSANGAFPVTRLKTPYDFYPVKPPFKTDVVPDPSNPIEIISTDTIEP